MLAKIESAPYACAFVAHSAFSIDKWVGKIATKKVNKKKSGIEKKKELA